MRTTSDPRASSSMSAASELPSADTPTNNGNLGGGDEAWLTSETLPKKSVSSSMITKGIEVEFDRTLPYWRHYTDLRVNHRRVPTVMRRETSIIVRERCTVFPGVYVVWANTEVDLRVPSTSPGKHKRYRAEDPECRLTRYWRDIPYVSYSWKFGTMHFVHADAHKKGKGNDRSYHIQSVVLFDQPALLQCVAATMVSFAFIVYSSLALLAKRRDKGSFYNPLREFLLDNESKGRVAGDTPTKPPPEALGISGGPPMPSIAQLQKDVSRRALWELCPSPATCVLILGMGGNSMALCLRAILGPEAEVHVVELEPAVLKTCRVAGTWCDEDHNMHAHLFDAKEYLKCLDTRLHFDMVFLDLFEPLEASMQSSAEVVVAALEALRPGGLAVVNDHRLPTPESLSSFVNLVGASNVQAVNLRGWNESIIVCVKPGEPANDGNAGMCNKRLADTVYSLYDNLVPGWLPHPTWLKTSHTVGKGDGRCRIWTS